MQKSLPTVEEVEAVLAGMWVSGLGFMDTDTPMALAALALLERLDAKDNS